MSGRKEKLNNTPSVNTMDHKQRGMQAEEAEQLYIDMVELAPDAITTIDTNGIITSCNTALTRMLGYTKHDFLGTHISKLESIRPEDLPKYLKLFQDILSGKSGESIEISLQRKDGTPVFIEARVSLLKIADRTVLQAHFRDITERKRMEQEIQAKNEQLETQNEELQATEEELRAANEELQSANDELREAQEQLIRSEKLAAIGQLASGVGHELRNPLGAIKNAVFYIQRRLAKTELPATEPRVMEFLSIIDGEVDAANKVITDLLGFSRVAKPTVSPVSVTDIVDDALMHISLPENIELAKDIGAGLPPVMVDADQMRQVFVNIFLNAEQAMTEGGHLNIKARRQENHVEVACTDTGGGIPKDVISKIFDPLFTTKAKGIGLGLSVCKSILERHGGDISVKSQPGKGSTFTLSLPAQQDAAGTGAEIAQ